MMYVLFTIIPLALLVFALVDAISTDDSQVKHLPKLLWVLLIVILPVAGSVAWLIAGKDRTLPQRPTLPASRPHTAPVEMDELAAIEREIEHHEREARIRRLEAEIEARKREKR